MLTGGRNVRGERGLERLMAQDTKTGQDKTEGSTGQTCGINWPGRNDRLDNHTIGMQQKKIQWGRHNQEQSAVENNN